MAAIAYAHARFISRKGGGSATRSAAYNARDRILDERTQQVHRFEPDDKLTPDNPQYREKPLHHGVLLPEGAPAAFGTPSVLWNSAELAERRKDSQTAREVLLALPNDPEVTPDDWHEMTVSFANEHFVSKGLAVQYDIHIEHKDNPHSHLLVSTRRVDENGFAAKKARDLAPEVRRVGTRRHVTEAEHWGETWRQHQNEFFASRGYELRVEPLALVSRTRLRMRTRDDQALKAHIEEARRINADAASDPTNVLAALTRHDVKFSEADIDRFLQKHLPDPAERIAVKAQVMAHPELVDRAARHLDGGGYTTRQVEQAGRKVEQAGREVASQKLGRISPDLDSRYNRGGGWYDEDTSYGRRM